MSDINKKLLIIFGSIWAGSLIVLIVFHIFALSPQISALDAVEQQILEQTKSGRDDSTTKEKLKQINNLNSKFGEFAIESSKWMDITTRVSNIISQLGIKDSSVYEASSNDITKIESCENLVMRSITAKFSSSFYQFAQFVNQLEGGKPAIFLNKFSITRSNDSGKLHSVEANLLVIVETGGKISSEKINNEFALNTSTKESVSR